MTDLRQHPPRNTLRRLRLQLTAPLLLLAPTLLWAAAQPSLGVVNWIGYGPIYCAAANGYYKKYGADVRLVTFSDNSLMSGALEGG